MNGCNHNFTTFALHPGPPEPVEVFAGMGSHDAGFPKRHMPRIANDNVVMNLNSPYLAGFDQAPCNL